MTHQINHSCAPFTDVEQIMITAHLMFPS